MDILIGLVEMLAKMAVFTAFAFGGIFLGKYLRDRKNKKLETNAEKPSASEEE